MMMPDDHDQDIIDKAIYLPLLVINLNRDLLVVEKAPFKIKEPYVELIEEVLRRVQLDLAEIKKYMYRNKIKVHRMDSDVNTTKYLVVYKGYQIERNIGNIILKGHVTNLFNEYMKTTRPHNG